MEEEEQAEEEDEEENEEEEEESSSVQESDELTSVEVTTEVTSESVMLPISNTNQKLYFDITFDNINQKIGVRHHVRGKRNTMLNMVQLFATLERIGSYGMSNVFPSPEAIRNVKISDILPSSEEEMALKGGASSYSLKDSFLPMLDLALCGPFLINIQQNQHSGVKLFHWES